MKANDNNKIKLTIIGLIIQTVMLNSVYANDAEIDAEFLEFLADMEEATGSGFNAWLNDADIDHTEDQYSIHRNEETKSIEQQK